jgi:hypothetical protein
MSAEVDGWMAGYAGPQKALMQAVREAVLAADARVTETIKWAAPTFVFNGNMATFNPRAKAATILVFHKGGTIRGEFPSLEGEGPEGRQMKFADAADLDAKREELGRVVRAWCDQRAG